MKLAILTAVVLTAALAAGSSVAASSNALRQAEAAMASGNYEYAYSQWKKVLAQWPGHPEASAAVVRIGEIAGAMFQEASEIRAENPQRSKDLLRTVVLISDPWSELNRQARQQLGDE